MMPPKDMIGMSVAIAFFGWLMWRTWKSAERAETDPRQRRRILLGLGLMYVLSAAIAIAVVFRAALPRNQKILVAYIQGDVFSHSTNAKVWKYGDSIQCVLASGWHQFPPDKRGDVLLCGEQTQLAWSQVWFRSDTKDQVYEAARMFDVTFHGTGRAGRRYMGPTWWCKRLSQSVDCE